jgi:hypothetical protein
MGFDFSDCMQLRMALVNDVFVALEREGLITKGSELKVKGRSVKRGREDGIDIVPLCGRGTHYDQSEARLPSKVFVLHQTSSSDLAQYFRTTHPTTRLSLSGTI